MNYPSRADELVEKLRNINPLQAAREKIGNRKKKKEIWTSSQVIQEEDVSDQAPWFIS